MRSLPGTRRPLLLVTALAAVAWAMPLGLAYAVARASADAAGKGGRGATAGAHAAGGKADAKAHGLGARASGGTAGVAFVVASGSSKGTRPEFLLDGNSKTSWCAPPQGPAWLVIGFTERAAVKEIALRAGDGRDAESFTRHARASGVRLTDGRVVVELPPLSDEREPQSVTLETPLDAWHVRIEITATTPGEPGEPLCLGDLSLGLVGRATRLTRAPLAPAGLGEELTGVWVDGPKGVPTHVLVLQADGRFRFLEIPLEELDPARAKLTRGTWKVRGDRLLLGVGKGAPRAVELAGPRAGQLTLSGAALPSPALSRTFRFDPEAL